MRNNLKWYVLLPVGLLLLLASFIAACIPVTPSVPSPTLTPSPSPVPALTSPQPTIENLSNVYIGCLHSAHTTYSGGKLEYPVEFYSAFKPYWDWLAATDHDQALTPQEWQSMIENANTYNDKNFVSFLGYEWTSSIWGHLSVVFRGEPSSNKPILATSSAPSYDNPGKLYAFLAATDGLAVFAHPAVGKFRIDFNQESVYRNDAIACLVAMLNNGAIYWSKNWDYVSGKSIPNPRPPPNPYTGGWVKTALDRGYHLGFVGELDLHRRIINTRRYAYTGVVADSLTRGDIFKALKARHTYAVLSPFGLGKRILLRATSGSYLMGDIFVSDSNTIRLTLQGETDLAQFTLINLFVNGEIVESRTVSQYKLVENFSIMLPNGDNYTFFEVRAGDTKGRLSFAFTSPMYVIVGK